jgi:hypothetical protein
MTTHRVDLVDKMLDAIPPDFWERPQKVFEPTCGEEKIMLGIFERFYKGLEKMYPDEIERCRIIMTECVYFSDLSALNISITTERIKCHIQHYCGLNESGFEFNTYTGDTLELSIPPFNGSCGDKNNLFLQDLQDFTEKSIDEWLSHNGDLVVVHPTGWINPNIKKGGEFIKTFDLITQEGERLYLTIHGTYKEEAETG